MLETNKTNMCSLYRTIILLQPKGAILYLVGIVDKLISFLNISLLYYTTLLCISLQNTLICCAKLKVYIVTQISSCKVLTTA
jgi:hypothetical protein